LKRLFHLALKVRPDFSNFRLVWLHSCEVLGVIGHVQSDLTRVDLLLKVQLAIGLVAMHLLKPINLTGWKETKATRTPCAVYCTQIP